MSVPSDESSSQQQAFWYSFTCGLCPNPHCLFRPLTDLWSLTIIYKQLIHTFSKIKKKRKMPCVRKSTLSSALAAATATLSSIYSGSAPAATSAAVPTGIPAAASSAVVTGAAAQATGASGASGASTVPTATGNQTTYAGINIAGFDFGCGTDGTCTVVCSVRACALLDNSG